MSRCHSRMFPTGLCPAGIFPFPLPPRPWESGLVPAFKMPPSPPPARYSSQGVPACPSSCHLQFLPWEHRGTKSSVVPRWDRRGSAIPPHGRRRCLLLAARTWAVTGAFFTRAPKISHRHPWVPALPVHPRDPFPGLPGAMQPSFPLLLTEPKFSCRGCKGKQPKPPPLGAARPWLQHPQPPLKSPVMASGREVQPSQSSLFPASDSPNPSWGGLGGVFRWKRRWEDRRVQAGSGQRLWQAWEGQGDCVGDPADGP